MTDNTPLNAAASTPLTRLHEGRQKRWHQNGEALLSFENLRSWLNTAGLVLFVPRPQIAAPAPSLVEAVLGAATPAPTLEQTTEARSLLGRLIGEGIAVPLNLLGATGGAVGESPDFVASAAVFSYLFTLRGDKTWKQPPSTTGTNKVSALAAHTYEILAKSGPRSASDLTPELGNAVTETAVLRALGELWTHLRVLPMPQSDGRATLWELTSARFTKQIKAGANAGQPTALSALISLYLGQVAVATEDDIQTFLSPLAPRSRVRDVIHALTAARQLDTVAIEGRTMVHLTGEAPDFLAASAEPEPREQIEAVPSGAEAGGEDEASTSEAAEAGEGPRIKKFVAKPRKVGTGYLSKGTPAKSASRSFSKDRGARGERPASAGRERDSRGERPSFGSRDRGARPERPAFGSTDRGGRGERPAFGSRDRGSRGERPPFAGADRPAREARPGGRPDRERRPFQKSSTGEDTRPRFDRPWSEDRPKRPARREEGSAPFAGSRDTSDRPRPRREPRAEGGPGGWKPAFRDKTRGDRPPFREGGQRPPRREAGSERTEGRPTRFAKGPNTPARPFRRDAEGAGARPDQGERPARPFRRFDERPGGKRPFVRRTEGGAPEGRPARPFRPRPEGSEDRRERADRSPREFGGRDRKPSKFASKFAGKRPGPRGEGGFSARPRPAGKPGDRPSSGKGTFGKRPAKRTFKRKEDESA